MIESLIGIMRPLRLRGYGRLFNRFTPHDGRRQITVAGRVRMNVDLANGHQRMMFMGCFAYDLQSVIRALVREGSTFVDVGANVGFLSLLGAHLVGPQGRVIAIEPYPPTFEGLAAEIASNGLSQVEAHCLALSSSPGTLRLYVPPKNEHREFNVSVVPEASSTPVDVPAKTLDESFDAWGLKRVDLMKMDVEGAEPLVLAGGQRHLSSGTVRHMITEINGPYLAMRGSSPRQMLQQLKDLGFVPGRIKGGRVVPLDHEIELDENDEDDCLFVHQSVLNESK